MGRVKMKKKSTFIDMTAMSDVTVLLLTFFMLTSTFLAPEPATVYTPSSVSEEKVPQTNFVQVLVSPQGKIWLTMTNDTAKSWSNDSMRMDLLAKVVDIYNEEAPEKGKVDLSVLKQTAPINYPERFAKVGAFGVPLAKMKEFLDIEDPSEQEKWLKGEFEAEELAKGVAKERLQRPSGIPISMEQDQNNITEFQMWMKAARQTENERLKDAIKDGTGVAIKADKNTPFEVVHMVMDNLQTIKMNKFTLMTTLKEGAN